MKLDHSKEDNQFFKTQVCNINNRHKRQCQMLFNVLDRQWITAECLFNSKITHYIHRIDRIFPLLDSLRHTVMLLQTTYEKQKGRSSQFI